MEILSKYTPEQLGKAAQWLQESQVVMSPQTQAPQVAQQALNQPQQPVPPQSENLPPPPVKLESKGTEFKQIYGDFVEKDLKDFRRKYPVTTLISLVVFFALGILNVLNIFSPVAIISALVFLGITAGLGMSIGKDRRSYWDALKQSMGEIRDTYIYNPKPASDNNNAQPASS